MQNKSFDAVVIGSGIGGLCAAARLTSAGMRVLVAEKSPYLGGRCGHRERKGCLVTSGAMMIPTGPNSAIREAFDAVGIDMDVIDLTGRMRYRLGHGDYDLPPTGGGLYGMIEFAAQDIKEAKNLFRHIQIALFESMPSDSITIKDWFVEHTHNTGIINLFQGFCAALMGTNLHEVPAGEFFRFLKYSSKGSRFGMATKGNGSLVDDLAVALESMGSEVRRRARCTRILVDDGVLNGVEIHNSGGGIEIVKTDIVLSNSGPDLTVALAGGETKFDQEYLKKLHANSADAPIMHVSFVMDEPLVEDFAGCMVFCNTLNLIYLEIPSAILSNYSPKGKYLHVAYGAPADAANPNLDKELQNTIDELEINFPGFSARAEFLVKAKHRGLSPGMRRWAGYGMPVSTSIKGLYNVGDGCAPQGTIGTESAAASAREAVAQILQK